ncbi:Mpo1 family 2-hydroxy fatty acid dioxygenase [Pseudomonas huanghezhanensis]|uniref:Mpo1 family 2-hydroxy fatty acid dioxygenase n=1 Tax=Pseudomonas huanghezhanensis TaxID=3002903 RepID=UPI0022860C8B|nr:Mpo1-like protein [Pseudomonas sp. BSw22131]
MKNLTDHLSQYASYHRDTRNVVSHFLGIPMIVFAVAVLLSLPGGFVGGFWLSPATFVVLASTVFYLRLDVAFGVLMAVLLGLCLWGGALLAQQPILVWLSAGLGLFIVGWAIQFVGHYYEGRKPAFIDDISGLIIGPLFVVAELAFLLGMRKDLQHAIEQRVGATRKRDMKATI